MSKVNWGKIEGNGNVTDVRVVAEGVPLNKDTLLANLASAAQNVDASPSIPNKRANHDVGLS